MVVKAIKVLLLRDGWELSSVRDIGDSGRDDVSWITRFASEGGDAILTADADFHKHEPQVNAIFATGLKVIYLPSGWVNAKVHLQVAHVLQWWRRIESTLETMAPRECYRTVYTLKEPKELKPVKIDFTKHQKKRRKRNRLQNN